MHFMITLFILLTIRTQGNPIQLSTYSVKTTNGIAHELRAAMLVKSTYLFVFIKKNDRSYLFEKLTALFIVL